MNVGAVLLHAAAVAANQLPFDDLSSHVSFHSKLLLLLLLVVVHFLGFEAAASN